jgi:cytosine/adenosine deaminase-related metal-dependent hydrolase
MLAEVRQALLLNRLGHGAAAITVKQALRMATLEGARCLGRDDIGSLEPGKRADIALFDLEDPSYCGAEDPLSALLLCFPTPVSTLVIDGRVVVEDRTLQTLPLARLLRRHRRIASASTGTPDSLW